MTREEAIRILRKEIECMSHTKCEDCILEKVCDPMITTPFDTEYIEVYEMAIIALEQEPCEDAISRQAVHELVRSLTRWCVRSEDGKFNNVGLLYDDVMFGIDRLPSINPQPCNDAISRQAVLDLVNSDWKYEGLELDIENLPSVKPQEPKWISVNERLPDKGGKYIVTEKIFSLDDREHKRKSYLEVEQVEFYNGKWQRASFYEVVAWMPLPKPYEPQESEE